MTEGPKEFYQTEKHPLGISRLKEEKEEEKRKEKKAEEKTKKRRKKRGRGG